MLCNEVFESKTKLNIHLMSHTKDKHFICEICGVKYRRITRLEVHTRTHSNHKPFKCDYEGCNKSFNERGNLITHTRVHTNEKPFICQFTNCNSKFKAHGHLKDHMKKHYNIKPYTCLICNSTFSRNSTLKMHWNTHVSTKPYLCPVENCNKYFDDKAQIKFHMKSHYFGKTNFEEAFKTYLEENKDKINDLINIRNEEIKLKSKNKRKLKPNLPKYIKKGNTYDIVLLKENLTTSVEQSLHEHKIDNKTFNDNKVKQVSFENFLGEKRNRSITNSKDSKHQNSSLLKFQEYVLIYYIIFIVFFQK